jgi:hypothetical protein
VLCYLHISNTDEREGGDNLAETLSKNDSQSICTKRKEGNRIGKNEEDQTPDVSSPKMPFSSNRKLCTFMIVEQANRRRFRKLAEGRGWMF